MASHRRLRNHSDKQFGHGHRVTYMDERVLVVIPARGGSKRIERKNLQHLDGKPLVAHAIFDANNASSVDEAIVSTDDGEIQSVARDYGGTAPFLRPAELATDNTPTAPVITHALNWVEEHGARYDIVCCIQTTAPLRKSQDINGALNRLVTSDADSVVSVSEFLDPPQWSVAEDDDGYLYEFFDSDILWGESTRSQDLISLKHPNGAVFAAYVDAWREQESFYTDKTIGYEMPPLRSFDIDEPWEMELVRALSRSEFGN